MVHGATYRRTGNTGNRNDSWSKDPGLKLSSLTLMIIHGTAGASFLVPELKQFVGDPETNRPTARSAVASVGSYEKSFSHLLYLVVLWLVLVAPVKTHN